MKNSVMLIGRPTTQLDDNNSFRIVVSEKTYNNATREWEHDTQYFECVCDQKVVSRAKWGIQVGKQIALEGRLKTKDNGTVYILVQDLFMIDRTND